MREIGNADHHEVGRRLNNRAEKFASAVSTTRTGHATISKRDDTAKIQLSPRSGQQPFQSGASSRHPRSLQTETLGRAGRVARYRGLIAAWVWAYCAIRRRPAVTLTMPARGVLFRRV